MKIYRLKKRNLPKVLVLATGLAAAALAVTMSPQAAHAYPSQAQDCANCHTFSTSTATTATPSVTTVAAGATYTVAITLAANPTGGNSGYAIIPVTALTGTTNGGNAGALLSYTATMTAPTAVGAYNYTVYTNQGSKAAGQTGSATYPITVTGGATNPPPTTTSTPPATTPPPTTPPESSGDIHGPYTLSSGQCATCHRTHTAKAPNLLKSGARSSLGSQSTLCLSCHDGTVASADAQFALARPANVAATRDYYSHDAVGTTPTISHTLSNLDEFGGVSNRHSECTDCHNPHRATVSAPRNSVMSTTTTDQGWDASQRLAGVSGVSVFNGAAGSTPTYTFLSGVDTKEIPANLVTREYQLCFKCHSGFTTLTSNADLEASNPPQLSKYALDKGVEFNPANPSFHPVEAAGKNTTPAMIASLAGTSTYKLWDFKITDTVRCLNCHASSSTPDPDPTAVPPIPGPGADSALAPHTSSNRGILLRNYRDRVLKPGADVLVAGIVVDKAAYNAGDFALCYVCHSQAPFGPPDAASATDAANQTNFALHSKHLSGIAGKGSLGTDIDAAGDGGGNAICAECHFRLHSTTNKVGVPGNTRLVSFAPNVQPYGTTLSWTTTGTGSGSCTLTCHSVPHKAVTYGP